MQATAEVEGNSLRVSESQQLLVRDTGPLSKEIEKQLNINGKDEIEKFGVAEFNQKCKDSVFEYKKEWDTLTTRIGYWLDRPSQRRRRSRRPEALGALLLQAGSSLP